MVPYRETITRRAVGERKYVRYFNGRGHFAHLTLELLPRAEHLPLVTAAGDLELPEDCHHAARAALFTRFEHGPIRGLPLIGLEARLLAATYLPAYSHADAFAAAASMALDEALIRLRVEGHALSATIETLTKFLGSVHSEISLGDGFLFETEIPARLQSKVASALGITRPDTYPLREDRRYRPLSGPLDHQTPDDTLGDWT